MWMLVGVMVVLVLGGLKHRPALKALKRLARHRACFVRNAALGAMGSISGAAVKTTVCDDNINCF